MKRVVITGMGALTPLGNNVADFWENVLKGTSGAGHITRFDASKHKTKFACELKNFNALDHFDRKELRKYDEFCQYALVAVGEAMKDSELKAGSFDPDRAGVIWGTGYGGVNSVQEGVFDYVAHDHNPRFSPFFLPKVIINMTTGHIAIKFGLKGVNYMAAAACASSNVCIFEGFNHIRNGYADIMVCGGSEAAITELGIGGFNGVNALSLNNEGFSTACKPFDIARDGFVMGEGAGAVILEDLEHAISRGAKIYGEIIGWGCTSNAYHMTATHPEGLGAASAIRLALKISGIKPDEVDMVNAHATSTPLGDPCEINAICSVFGDHASKLNITAPKSMTGHLLGGAGAVESIITIKAIQEDIVPPTINTTEIDPIIPANLNLTLGKPQKRTINVAINSTFGFGGHNVITVFKKFI